MKTKRILVDFITRMCGVITMLGGAVIGFASLTVNGVNDVQLSFYLMVAFLLFIIGMGGLVDGSKLISKKQGGKG